MSRNLENFDENSRRMPVLDSPRSIEACRRQGIRQEELIVVSRDELI
jgi:hypothetical protein